MSTALLTLCCVPVRQCAKCLRLLPLTPDTFHRDSSRGNNGYSYYCRRCRSALLAAWCSTNAALRRRRSRVASPLQHRSAFYRRLSREELS